MDSDNSEHFVYVNGEAQYPSPVEPELLEIDHVYPYDFEEKYINEDEDFDLWSIATDELIQWFSECWKEMGGDSFQLKANIAPHDNDQAYNLVESKWEERQKYTKVKVIMLLESGKFKESTEAFYWLVSDIL